MLGNCSSCGDGVGYFKLQDTICSACISQKCVLLKGKIPRIFLFSPFWGFIFIAGFIAHIAIIATNPIAEQIALSVGLMVLALVSFITSFILRFYLLRRRAHIALALIFSFPFVAVFSTIIGFAGTSPASLTTLGFIFFPFYILRLLNFALNSDKHQQPE